MPPRPRPIENGTSSPDLQREALRACRSSSATHVEAATWPVPVSVHQCPVTLPLVSFETRVSVTVLMKPAGFVYAAPLLARETVPPAGTVITVEPDTTAAVPS